MTATPRASGVASIVGRLTLAALPRHRRRFAARRDRSNVDMGSRPPTHAATLFADSTVLCEVAAEIRRAVEEIRAKSRHLCEMARITRRRLADQRRSAAKGPVRFRTTSGVSGRDSGRRACE
jgi:hypothetical protein